MPATRRPLIVRLRNWIGDVVLALPALEHLSQQGYDLVLVGKPWARDLLSGTPWQVHAMPRPLARARASIARTGGALPTNRPWL